jgi:hypothetical protein
LHLTCACILNIFNTTLLPCGVFTTLHFSVSYERAQ